MFFHLFGALTYRSLRLQLMISGMILFVFPVAAAASPDNREEDSLLTVARDETRTREERLSSFADLVVRYGGSDPVKALRLGREGLDLPDRERLHSNAQEMALLRQKIEDYASVLPHKFTIKRDEVNFFLKKALSSRELDVFMLLLKGFSNHKIAEQLFVSVNTVKFHLQNIYVKLDVKNRAEAVLFVSKG